MKTVFKVGDKVFDARYGWGEVSNIDNDKDLYPIYVTFNQCTGYYTWDGRDHDADNLTPILSFTKYTLQGFSQESPEVLPNRGDIVWVRNNENEDWTCAQFMWKVDGSYRASIYNPWKESNGVHYIFLTTINPYINEN